MTTIALIAASTFAMLVALFFAYQAGVARWPTQNRRTHLSPSLIASG